MIAPPKKAKKHKDVETIAAPPPHFEAPHPLQFGGEPSSNRRETDQTRASDAAAFAKWQASAAKAAASEETNMNEQEKSEESSDSVSYVTRKEFQHLQRAVNALCDKVEKVEKKERDSHDSVASGGSAYPIVSMPPKAPPPTGSTLHRVGSSSDSETQRLAQMVVVVAAKMARGGLDPSFRCVGEPRPKHGKP